MTRLKKEASPHHMRLYRLYTPRTYNNTCLLPFLPPPPPYPHLTPHTAHTRRGTLPAAMNTPGAAAPLCAAAGAPFPLAVAPRHSALWFRGAYRTWRAAAGTGAGRDAYGAVWLAFMPSRHGLMTLLWIVLWLPAGVLLQQTLLLGMDNGRYRSTKPSLFSWILCAYGTTHLQPSWDGRCSLRSCLYRDENLNNWDDVAATPHNTAARARLPATPLPPLPRAYAAWDAVLP